MGKHLLEKCPFPVVLFLTMCAGFVAELRISLEMKAEERKMFNRNKCKQLLFSSPLQSFSHVQPGLILQLWAVHSFSHR